MTTMANLTDTFNNNFKFLKFFGLMWPGKKLSKYFKCYSVFYLFTTLLVYDLLLILSLFCTPRKLELLIREILFFFSEMLAVSKVLMIYQKEKAIVKAFCILHSEPFKGQDDKSKLILSRYINIYKTFWKYYSILSNVAIFTKMCVHFYGISHGNVELPFYNYYFLQKETHDRYFVILWVYQVYGIYGHMIYNINIVTFIAGLILIVIAQVDVLDLELRDLKSDDSVEEVKIMKLNKCLTHYEMLILYANEVQDIISVTMFIQFVVASGSICAILCSLLLPETTTELMSLLLFLSTYACVEVLEIFVPSYLGTQLSYKSQRLVDAAYCSDWIVRSEKYKRSLKLFMLRANVPIVFSGCGRFPLTLDTFISIMKTAYSFFTLVRNVQNREK